MQRAVKIMATSHSIFLLCTSELPFILTWIQKKGLAKLSGAEKDHMRSWECGSPDRVFIQYTYELVFHP